MKLITEVIEDVSSVITEDNGEKTAFIEGKFIQGDVKNRNGRVYPSQVLEREVNRYIQEVVNKNRAYGELGHPPSPAINLDKVSHMITNLHREGSDYIGKAKIIEKTPMGSIAKSLIEAGANLGVSTRGVGSLREKNGIMEVQQDFRLSTVDIVSDPSGPDCFVNGIMEGTEWYLDDNGWKQVEETKEEIETSVRSRELSEEKKVQIFEKFMKSLKS